MNDLKILQGLLSDPEDGMRIGIVDSCWVLSTGEGNSYEVLVSNENWDTFLFNIKEYSDYVSD